VHFDLVLNFTLFIDWSATATRTSHLYIYP